MARPRQINVLLIFANPLPKRYLQLDWEERQIRQAIERSIYREHIKLVSRQAATVADLQRALLEGSYQIVHLSGHGYPEGIVLADERHGYHLIPPAGLAQLFQRHKALRCAVLNISARLDRRTVEGLTRRFLQKYGWDTLKPLIEETVQSLFLRQFQQEARSNLQRWVRLASSREVVRPLRRLSALFSASCEELLFTEGVLFGSTPFRAALDWAARRFLEPRYQGHHKVLLIISDGAFPYMESALITARLLKRRGVVIVSGLVHRQKLLDRLLGKPLRHWPPGARCMLELASELSEVERLAPKSKAAENLVPCGKKYCYQLNHAGLLEPLLDFLCDDPVAAED